VPLPAQCQQGMPPLPSDMGQEVIDPLILAEQRGS
jgi:hypothetical protein